MGAKNYRDLVVWQKAMELAGAIHEVTKSFPKDELYGLVSQMRRAAISVPSNVAEGEGRNSPREFVHFLRIAHGSLRELETQVLLGERFGYLRTSIANDLMEQSGEVGRLINGLIRSLDV